MAISKTLRAGISGGAPSWDLGLRPVILAPLTPTPPQLATSPELTAGARDPRAPSRGQFRRAHAQWPRRAGSPSLLLLLRRLRVPQSLPAAVSRRGGSG